MFIKDCSKNVVNKTVANNAALKKTIANKTVEKTTVEKTTVANNAEFKKTTANKTVANKTELNKTIANKTVAKKAVVNKTNLLLTLCIRRALYLPTGIVPAADHVIRALAVDPRSTNIVRTPTIT